MKKILLFAAVLATGNLFSQIIYNDIVDSTYSGNYDAYIDIDGDMTDDFLIHGENVATTSFNFVEGGNVGSTNQVLEQQSLSVKVLSANDVIGSNSSLWFTLSSSNTTMTSFNNGTPIAGLWDNQTDKYLGVHFYIGATQHYGWIRVSTGSQDNTLTIKDFAYNTTAGDSILAGQTVITSVDGLEKNTIKLYPNPVTNQLFVENVAVKNYTLFNIGGQLITSGQFNGNSIDLSSVDAGIYFVELVDENNNKTRSKIIIE